MLAECLLGVLVQTTGGAVNTACSYAVVLLACGFTLLFFEPTLSYVATQLALVTTVCADYFLVVREPRVQLTAMLFFSVTQLSYFARLYKEDTNKKRRKVHVLTRIAVSLFALLLTWLVLRENTDAVAMISIFYFANLLLNVLFAFLNFEKPGLLATGLLLFSLCDLFIGLSLIEGYVPLAEGSFLYHLAHPGFNAAWIFYVPSQALLALSLLPKRLRTAKSA